MSRREFGAEQKAVVLREHLIEKVSVTDSCDEHGLQPTAFCRRQNEMLENLVALFERRGHKSNANALEERVEALRKRLARKDAIIAEIMGDFVAAGKRVGRIDSGAPIPSSASPFRRSRSCSRRVGMSEPSNTSTKQGGAS